LEPTLQQGLAGTLQQRDLRQNLLQWRRPAGDLRPTAERRGGALASFEAFVARCPCAPCCSAPTSTTAAPPCFASLPEVHQPRQLRSSASLDISHAQLRATLQLRATSRPAGTPHTLARTAGTSAHQDAAVLPAFAARSRPCAVELNGAAGRAAAWGGERVWPRLHGD